MDPKELKGLIMLNLKGNKYEVEAVTNSGITFDGYPGRNHIFEKLGSGKIEISYSNSVTTVKLIYYINLIPALAFFLFSLTFGIISGAYICPVVFFLVLSIHELIRIAASKNVALRLLNDLLT